jgi:hypothetical protein
MWPIVATTSIPPPLLLGILLLLLPIVLLGVLVVVVLLLLLLDFLLPGKVICVHSLFTSSAVCHGSQARRAKP